MLTDSLLIEVENKLKKAVRTGVIDIAVAQTLLGTARAKCEKENQTAKLANEMQKTCQ